MNLADVPDGPLVVDTDVASWILSGHQRAEPFKPLLRDHVLCLSFATVGELWAGAENAKWGQPRRDGLAAFVRRHLVLPVDDEIARWWGRVHANFRDQVDVNDEWIAACALAQRPSLGVATGNLKHFRAIAARFPALTIVHPEA